MTEAMGGVPDSLQAMNLAPLVKGYYDGGDLYFIHTEASDSAVANLLTEMMGAAGGVPAKAGPGRRGAYH